MASKVSDITITGNSIDAQGAWSGPAGPTVGGGIEVDSFANVTISGNNINGHTVLPNGIETRQGKHLTITGNTVLSVTDHGILASATLVGGAGDAFMEHFTITGNTVDGWLDDNATPGATGIHVGYPSDNGAPMGGVINGNNVRKCAHGICLQGFSQAFPVRDMVVNNNIVSECAFNQVGYNRVQWSDSGTKGIGIQYGFHVTVQGNSITALGIVVDPGTDAPIGFANDVYPRGVYSLNSDRVTVANNNLSNFHSKGVLSGSMGISYTLGNLASAYDAEAIQITDNTYLSNDTNQPLAQQGVSVVLEDDLFGAEISDLAIRGNTIAEGTSEVGIGVQVFVGSRGMVSGCGIEDNSVTNYLVTGIGVLLQGPTPTQDCGMYNLRIRGNSVTPDNVTGPLAGIYVQAGAATAFSSVLAGVTIEDNSVHPGWGNGIVLDCVASTATTGLLKLDKVAITGNRVLGLQKTGTSGAAGIYIGLTGGLSTAIRTGYQNLIPWQQVGVQDIRVTDNFITYVDQAIVIKGKDVGACEQLTVNNNQCEGRGTNIPNPLEDYLSLISFVMDDVPTGLQTFSAISVSGNSMIIGQQDRQIDNLKVVFENAELSVLSMQDNTLNAMTATSSGPGFHGRALHLHLPVEAAVPVGRSCKEMVINGNVLGGGIHVLVEHSDPTNVDVSSNQVVIPEVDGDAQKTTCILLQFDGKDQAHAATSVSADNNSVSGGALGVCVQYDDMKSETLCVRGNRVTDAFSEGISVLVDQGSGSTTDYQREISITGNTVARNSNGDSRVGIFYKAGTAPTQALEISGNQIYNQDMRAIHCFLGGDVTPVGTLTENMDRNIQVRDNTIDYCGKDASALPIIAVEVDGAASVSTAVLSAFSISGNTISNSGYTSRNIAIYVDLSPYAGAKELCFDGNILSPELLKSKAQVPSGYGSGIELDLPETTGLSIDNNVMGIYGFTGDPTAGCGIYVSFLDCQAHGVSISGNVMHLEHVARYGIRIRTGATRTMSIKTMTISDNQISAVADDEIYCGIHWVGEDGAGDYSGTIEGVQVIDNTITDLKTGVWVIQSDNGMAHNNLYLKSCAMDGNAVTDCKLDGMRWTCGGIGGRAGNTHGFSASRNSVITQYLNTSGAQPHYGHPMVLVELGRGLWADIGSSNVHQVSVDGNHCYITTADQGDVCWSGVILEIGIVEYTGAEFVPHTASTISVSNNHVRNVALVGIGFIVDGCMTYDGGNNVVTGVSRVRTCTVSDNIVSMSNTQETQGGAATERNGGILLKFLSATLDQFQFQGNAIRGADPQGDRHLLNIWGEVTGVPAPNSLPTSMMHEVLTFQGNSVINNGQSGLARDCIKVNWMTGGAPAVPDKGIVTNNINSETQDPAMSFDGAEWIFTGAHFHSLSSNVKI
jgi:hypothetical protein